jgi:hypothetical protein
MKMPLHPNRAICPLPNVSRQLLWLALSLFITSLPICARANIYATSLRLNGGATNIPPSGTNYTLSYVLNEPATLGVTVEILSGTNVIRSFSLPSDGPGTAFGTNLITWDGRDSASNSLAPGVYTFRVTAGAAGFVDWTQTSDDFSPGNYVYEPRGIAVNKNPGSPYYGRVFVGNAFPAANQTLPGDKVGLLKLNADGSPAEEGEYSDGGWQWSGGDLSPWKLEVAPDDRVYVNDWSGAGTILSFDQTLSSNSLRLVLRSDNWPDGGAVNLSGPFVSRSGTNNQIWMADARPGGVGIRRWNLNAGGVVSSNDVGITVVKSDVTTNLDVYPYDVALDRSNRIYTIQYRPNTPNDSSYRVFRFAAYNDGDPAETNADWKIGSGDNTMAGAAGISVDPTATYVAVAFRGLYPFPGTPDFGSVRVFYATNGAPVVKPTPTESPNHDYWDATWDNVGNLYVVDNIASVWRVYSPPGKNQATTVATATLTVPGAGHIAPILTNASYANGQFQCLLLGEADTTYIIQASTNLVNWDPVATNTAPTATRSITVAAPAKSNFYRALVGVSSPARPVLSSPALAGNQFQFTLTGTANATYIIQASTDLQNWIPILTNTSANAVRSIIVPASGPRNLYRAQLSP